MKPGWFVHPVMSAAVAATWLLLQQSLAVPQLITAAVLGLVLPRLVHGFTGTPRAPRALGTALRLALVVLRDIVVANVTVARLVLSPWARPVPAWVPVELDVRDPRAVTLLATIITTTPGTVSCVVDEARHRLLVHALDGSAGADAIAADIKARYEAPLKEIFE
jgi:multicomponent K+:H+ antiporter subunit E